ncbi:MAG: hypothetical protein IT306_11985 [Chloroflexi bacterium]|nr:hypothetical protein [Chloroflexota bacterium]
MSPTDSRYFEYDDGSYFSGLGFNTNFDHISWNDPVSANQSLFQNLSSNGVRMVRHWLSQWGVRGVADSPWTSTTQGPNWDIWTLAGAANSTGYVPSAGSSAAMFLDPSTNPGIFLGWLKKGPAVKPSTTYRVRVHYQIPAALSGPVTAGQSYGLVAMKHDVWVTGPHQAGSAGTVLTPYATAATGSGWSTLEGTFTTGSSEYFLPYFYLVLKNTSTGGGSKVFIDQVDIVEDLGGGSYGVNILSKPDMDMHEYFDQRQSRAFDLMLDLAAQNELTLKLVVDTRAEWLLEHFDANGNIVTDDSWSDSRYYYGQGRTTAKSRWLLKSWWRYVQGRWGYSPAIHSWELLNEGDPFNSNHALLADEFALYMRQWGNRHPTTTSNWHSLPHSFWDAAPNVDYVDIHQYHQQGMTTETRIDMGGGAGTVVTALPADFYDTASLTQRISMQLGARQPFGLDKPIIRGETGLYDPGMSTDNPTTQLSADSQGIWLHKFLWAQLNSGGLIDSGWWYDRDHIYDATDGSPNRLAIVKRYFNFIDSIPLSNGHYQEASATISDAGLRVWGQKDTTNGQAHLWIDNASHTWKAAADGTTVTARSGSIALPGMPIGIYTASWYDTYLGAVSTTAQVSTDPSGTIAFALPQALSTDIAVKLVLTTPGVMLPTPTPSGSVTPTPTPIPAVTVDSSNAQITFSGWWPTQSDGGAYGGSERVGEYAGDNASFTFSGTSVSVVYKRSADRGMASVKIDGTSVGILDQYGTTQAQTSTTYTTTPGNHTLQIIVNRAKQTSSTGYYVGVDAIVVGGSAPTPTATSATTSTPTVTATLPATSTPTATVTNTLLPTATVTNTLLPTATATRTPSPTATATPTNTLAPTATATRTPSPTATLVPPTATSTATAVPPTATSTATTVPPTATATATTVPPTATSPATATATLVPPTATATATLVPATATSTATATATMVPATATSTATAVPPTATSTATTVPPTATTTATLVPATATATVTLVPPTATSTSTPRPATATPTVAPATPTTFDDDHGSLSFSGWWPTQTDAGATGGTERIGQYGGDSVSMTYTGATISLIYRQNIDRGQAQVRIDGQLVQQIDQYGPSQVQRAITYVTAPGTHTIQVRVLRTKQAQSAGYFVGVDAFIVANSPADFMPSIGSLLKATVDDGSPWLTWAGTWGSQADSAALAGSQHLSSTSGATAALTFTGSAVQVMYRQDTDRGTATVYIDGVAVGQIDQYGSSASQQSVAYSVTPGAHTLQVVVNRAKQAASSGYAVSVDGFIVTGTAVAVAPAPSPTAVPTSTPVPPPTPTPTPTKKARTSRIKVTTAPAGSGRLAVTISTEAARTESAAALAASGDSCGDITAIDFQAAGESASNVAIDFPGGPSSLRADSVYRPTSAAAEVKFYIRRTAPGAVTVPITVTDGCGEWSTFVGGGASAF